MGVQNGCPNLVYQKFKKKLKKKFKKVQKKVQKSSKKSSKKSLKFFYYKLQIVGGRGGRGGWRIAIPMR
jgi:hypothetical protein